MPPRFIHLRTGRARLAKTAPPILPVVLARPRLFRLLDRSTQSRLTWVTAPAGSGKTTLVASYLKARRRPTLWYRLDEGDSDPATFFHYLSQAARLLAPKFRKPFPRLTPEYALGLPTFARRYFQTLGSRFPKRCLLVLDNYQDVPSDSPLHHMLACGCYELPVSVSVIVLSRDTPHAAVVRMQAEQMVAVIGPSSLQLTKTETLGIVRLHLKSRRGRPAETLANELHQRASGWAAGLLLLLEQVKIRQPSIQPASAGDTSDSVFHFLAANVLDKFDQDVQDILVKTSILSDMSVPLVQRATGFPKAGEVLQSLHAARCFIERRDKPEPWYRYHPLFREFLLRELLTRYSQEEVRRLRQQAAVYLAELGQHEESLALLRLAEDWMAMGRQIIVMAPAVLAQGRFATVEQWIGSMPRDVVEQEAWLQFWWGCSRMFRDLSAAKALFEQAFEQFIAQKESAGYLLAWTNIVRCILLQWKGLPRLDHWLDRFESLQPEGAPYPSSEIEAQLAEAMAGALVWRRPESPRTRYWLERAIVLNNGLTGSVAGHAIFLTESYLAWLGDLDGVRNGNDRLLERATRPGAAPSMKIVYYLGEAMLGWIEGRVEDCRKAVQQGLALGEREGIHLWDGWLMFQDIHNNLLSGQLETAREQLDHVKGGVLEGLYLSQYRYHAAWHSMLVGDWPNALLLAEQAVNASVQDGGPFPESLCCLIAASIAHNVGDREKAEAYRHRAETIAVGMDSDLLRYGAWLLAAQFAFDAGDRHRGLASLRDAFELGRKKRITEYPGWQSQAVARLCGIALQENIEVQYVQEFIPNRWLPLSPDLRPTNWPWAIKIYVLGKLSIEVQGQPLEKGRKAPHRLLDLLAAIVAFGGIEVPITRLVDVLWPEADGDQAQQNFKKSVSRVRKMLGVENVMLWQDGKITLNRDLCWVDVMAFEALARQADSQATNTRMQDSGEPGNLALALYRGPFLGLEDIPEWARSYHNEIRNRWVRLLTRRGDQLDANAGVSDAVRELEAALEIDPVAEPLYQRLIPLLLAKGRRSEAAAQYDRCRAALARWGNRTPSAATERLAMAMIHPGERL